MVFCAVMLGAMSIVAIAATAGEFSYVEPYAVAGLSVGMPVVRGSWQYKRYTCEKSEQFANSTWCEFKEKTSSGAMALTILHLNNNVATYVNKTLGPAKIDKAYIDREIERLKFEFKSAPRIYRSPKRAGGQNGVIAVWGAVKLEALAPDDLAALAVGESPKQGILVDFRIDTHGSARAGLPVYGVRGGAGYVFVARYDDATGRGKLRWFAADASQMNRVAAVPKIEPMPDPGEADRKGSRQPDPPPDQQEKQKSISTGTGFFVSEAGEIVTNAHVVKDCDAPQLTAGRESATARVLARDEDKDLALLDSSLRPRVAPTLRAPIRNGEDIAIFGFPLISLLSTGGNFTRGHVSANTGLRDNDNHLQISAPVQPGNSGGPMLDMSGNVVGVVVAKLDAKSIAEMIDDIPQNVNFAVKSTVLMNFLDAHGVRYATAGLAQSMGSADLYDRAKSMSMLILCER
jgi:S1-C subfamily serine protease